MPMARMLTMWIGVAAAAAGVAFAQDAPAVGIQSEPASETMASPGNQAVTVNEAGLFDAHLRDVPLTEAMTWRGTA